MFKQSLMVVLSVLSMSSADISIEDSEKLSAIYKTDDLSAFKEMVASGLDIYAESYHEGNGTCLNGAIKHKANKIAYYLIDSLEADIERKDEAGTAPIFMCAYTGNFIIFKKLIDRGAETKEIDGILTLLHAAAEGGNVGILDHLLKKGFSIDVTTIQKTTPLMHAAREGQNEALAFLIRKGAKLKYGVFNKTSALHQAVIHGHYETCLLLLQKGATVNTVDERGYTPLCYAVGKIIPEFQTGHTPSYEMAEALIKHGADVNLGKDWKPSILVFNHRIDLVDHDLVDLLDAKGVDWGYTSPEGFNAIFFGARSGRLDIIQKAIKAGADINVFPAQERNSLEVAILSGKKEVVDFIIDHGFKENIRSTSDFFSEKELAEYAQTRLLALTK